MKGAMIAALLIALMPAAPALAQEPAAQFPGLTRGATARIEHQPRPAFEPPQACVTRYANLQNELYRVCDIEIADQLHAMLGREPLNLGNCMLGPASGCNTIGADLIRFAIRAGQEWFSIEIGDLDSVDGARLDVRRLVWERPNTATTPVRIETTETRLSLADTARIAALAGAARTGEAEPFHACDRSVQTPEGHRVVVMSDHSPRIFTQVYHRLPEASQVRGQDPRREGHFFMGTVQGLNGRIGELSARVLGLPMSKVCIGPETWGKD